MATGRGVPRGAGGSGRSHREQPCVRCEAELDRAWRFCPRCGERAPVLRKGDTVDGRYEVIELLNQHEAREVYAARHLHLDEIRVLKILHGDLFDDESQVFRFRQEARLASKLRHPNIATLHDFSSLGQGTFYTAWEFLQGETARARLQREGRLPERDALDVAIQAANGLSAIHEAGIVHRSISPDNLMLSPSAGATREGAQVRARIIDFGIATALAADDTEAALRRGFVNARYASPEQLQDGHRVDPRSDIYALGLTLFELLAGRPPFDAGSDEGFIAQQIHEDPLPLRALLPEIPDMLEAVVAQALAKDPEKRFASAAEFRQALIRARVELDPDAAAEPGPSTADSGDRSAADNPLHRELNIDPSDSGTMPATPLASPAAMGVSIVFADDTPAGASEDDPLHRDLTGGTRRDALPDPDSAGPADAAAAATPLARELKDGWRRETAPETPPAPPGEPSAIVPSDPAPAALEPEIAGESVPSPTVRSAHPFLAVGGGGPASVPPSAPAEPDRPRGAASIPSAPPQPRRQQRKEFDPLRARKLPVPVIVVVIAVLLLAWIVYALARRSPAQEPETAQTIPPVPVTESPVSGAAVPPQTVTITPLLPPNVSPGPDGGAADVTVRELDPPGTQAAQSPGQDVLAVPPVPTVPSSPVQQASPAMTRPEARPAASPPPPATTDGRQRMTASEATHTLLTRVRRLDYYDARPDCLRAGAVQYRNEGYSVEIRTRSCPDGPPPNTLLGSWRVDAYSGEIFVRNERGRYVDP
jgi:eukaryotic-like serine/threonine-protein kinase